MCWGGQASASLALVGISTSAYLALKRNPESISLWLPLFYFSCMEVIQTLSYGVINQCDSPFNQALTLISFLHVSFQPFFINAIALYFMPRDAVKIISPWVYFACFVSTLSMLMQLYPFEWAGHCSIGQRPLCGDILCTVSGEWHLAWLVPTNGIGNSMSGNMLLAYGWLGYSTTCITLPLIIGSWRFTVFTILFGPPIAFLSTHNINEWPAIWCLYSVALCLAVIRTPLRDVMFVGTPWWMKIHKYQKSQ